MSNENNALKEAWFKICFSFVRPLGRIWEDPEEAEYVLQIRRPINDDDVREAIAAASRGASDISRSAVTFLTTVHVTGAFGTLAAIAQAQHLVDLASVKYALTCFIVGVVFVGVEIFLGWQHCLHRVGLADAAHQRWSARDRLWAEIDVLLVRLQTWAMVLSGALFVAGALFLIFAVYA